MARQSTLYSVQTLAFHQRILLRLATVGVLTACLLAGLMARSWAAPAALGPSEVGDAWVKIDQYQPPAEPVAPTAAPSARVEPPADVNTAEIPKWRKIDPDKDFAGQDAFPFQAMDPAEVERLAETPAWQSVQEHIDDADLMAKRRGSAKGQLQPQDLIRLPLLPSRGVSAIPDVRISKARLTVETPAAKAPAKKETARAPQDEKKAEETAAACESLAEMRKRQLQAMESDRQTLAALRQALQDMKLTKKLSFMAEQVGATEQESLAPAPASQIKSP